MASMPTSYFVLASSFMIVGFLLKLLLVYLWKPLGIRKAMTAQGIRGPPFHLFVGNIAEFAALKSATGHASLVSSMPPSTHNLAPVVFPHWVAWSAQYGKIFLYWMGAIPRLVLTDPDLCKEMLSDKLGLYPKATPIRPDIFDLLANGLVMLEGEKWAQHRRMVNPAFYMEKLKAMASTFIDLTRNMLDTWQSKLQSANTHVEIDVNEEFKALTADIIAHTAFGSSFAEGKQVFYLQYEQQEIFEKLISSFYIPGSRFLPTAFNRRRWRLSKQIETILGGIIHKRMHSPDGAALGEDLLGLMLSASKEASQGSQTNMKINVQDIIDECKTFFFAGHETTSSLLTWAAMLLAINPKWQEKAREEVLDLFGTSLPGAEALNQMKVVGMVLYETLRLYPPVTAIGREASTNLKLGNISIPQGMGLLVPILLFQIDPTLWGPDAHEFNPQRFANGVSKACEHPIAFQPFSTGPRNCVGQNFALMEAKIVLCMVLQRFRFKMSPGYKHAPTSRITLQPKHGMQIMLEAC